MKTCGICSHPERAAIDAALVEKGSLRAIAGQFGTTKSALDRHRKHIPAALTKAKQAEEVVEATSLLSRVERLMSRMETICQKATEQGEWAGAVGASRELRGCLELLGKLSGELQPNGARVAINFGDITKIDIRSLSDDQLNALVDRLDDLCKKGMSDEEISIEQGRIALSAGSAVTTVSEAHLFDEETVAAGAGGNHVCWDIRDGKAIEAAKELGQLQPDFECPPPKWTPYRNASPKDRFQMLQAAWKKVTGLDLSDRISMQDLGAAATIAIAFNFADPREEYWHSWPKVELRVSKSPGCQRSSENVVF
jgi:transposase-like protein